MDATQVAPMPVLHSVMMLKVSEASRATSVTRAAAAAAAAQAAASAHRRNSLTLSHHALHVSAESSSAVHHAVVPVTPHAADQLASKSSACSASSSSPAAAFSPREPSSKVAATSAPVFASKSQQSFSSTSVMPTPPAIESPSTPVASSCVTDSSPEPSLVGKRGHSSSTPKNSSSSPKSMKANTGRWTDAEHKLFLKGLETFPYRAWKKIATLIKTRTVVQIRTHAQKYYQKLEKEEARSKDREHHQHGSSSSSASNSLSAASLASLSAAHLSDDDYSDSSASTPRAASSPAKKKSMLRKRKFTMDDDSTSVASSSTHVSMDMDASSSMSLPSLPKRMMKEKKFPREKHMSPKQKAPVSGGNKFFGSSFNSPELGPESAHRVVFGRNSGSSSATIHKIPPHPLDFDDATSESMILDFADDKSMADYPFHLDGGMDTSISSMDNDDLLQLTDEESLDWFSTAADDDGDLLKVEPLDLVAAVDDVDSSSAIIPDCTTAMDIVDSSPLTLGRYHFSPLYTDECLQFSDSAEDGSSGGCSSPSSSAMLSSCDAEDFILSEDDDFVLDPEKFLSSYFSPSN
ncbi:Lhy protein [Globisporangium polare]